MGESIERFQRLFPNATIHAFEPGEETFSVLDTKYSNDNRVVLNNYGIGSLDGEAIYYKNVKSDTSGFIPINLDSVWAVAKAKQSHVEVDELTESAKTIRVKTLDGYIAENSIQKVNILKLDTQGYEDKCLEGCENSLNNNQIDIIETEIIVGDAYSKSLTFGDIENIFVRLVTNILQSTPVVTCFQGLTKVLI